jgi:hypothetical protein
MPLFFSLGNEEGAMFGARVRFGIGAILMAVAIAQVPTSANHSWNGYHWARTANPFTVELGDNLSSAWKSYLNLASSDWSKSAVLNTTVVTGRAKSRNCRPTAGRDEICNGAYGNNGWLGVAQIWVSGSHITQGTVRMNDTYFAAAAYNTPAWRQFVVCQEVGHTFGLDHQDENFDNRNLGTCMDYTSDPDGGGSNPSNLSPNQHDYDELVTIYSHFDSVTTVGQSVRLPAAAAAAAEENFGQVIRSHGRTALFMRDLGNNLKIFTFVIWA